MRALNEQIYTNELLIYRNKSLILLFQYIQAESTENQNYLPWLNKTSLVDVAHKVRELKPLQNFVSDNELFLEGYVNETKPYHVVIKEFLFDYTGGDVYPGTLTDFDLPATYDTTIDRFVSPELVYNNADTEYEFLPDDPIWQTEKYKEWFDNHGVSLSGQDNYQIATLESYLTITSQNIIVDNPQGFPINGTFTIGSEKISYATVDRATGIITGLTRGVDGTTIVDHLPGELIYMNLPGVLLLDGGRGYANPPRVIAVIDTTVYPEPKQEAVLEAVMSLDSVVGINIIDPGQGYAVLPEIVIDPADTFTFSSGNVNTITNTIELYAPALTTGDLVRYVAGTENIGGLADRQYYYVNVLDSSPTTIAALYTTYADALSDNTRVRLLSQGTGSQSFEYGARATPITSSYPVRENNITLRFDRTTYDTQVTDWAPNTFYGGEFVSYLLEGSSSSVSLASVQPDINTILSSAEGTAFPLVNVTNDRQVDWSSFERTVSAIVSNNELVLSYTSSGTDEYPSGSTIGFYVGMPVKFEGDTGSEIVEGTTYYINEIIGLDTFKISTTESGSALSLAPIPSADFKMYTAKVIDTAVLTSIYSGYRNVTNTYSGTNSVRVALTDIGTGGTNGFYTNLPVYFTTGGGMFGTNVMFYVVSVLGSEEFTLRDAFSSEPAVVRVYQTNLANQIIVENTNGLEVGDPVVFDSIAINGEASDTFGNIDKQTIYYIKTIGINVITISTTVGGSTFSTGVVAPADDTYCFITSQSNVLTLATRSGNATMVVGVPISPGQVNGQAFTFYPSSQNYADITAPDLIYGNLLEKTIVQTLAPYNQIAYKQNNSGLYIDIPFTVESNIGGLVTGKTYYAYDLTNVLIECQSTAGTLLTYDASFLGTTMTVTNASGTGILYPGSLVTGGDVQPNTYIVSYISGSGGNGTYEVSTTYFVPVVTTGCTTTNGIVTVDTDFDTNMMYVGMPIVFTEQSLGGVLLDYTYYVRHIINSTQFTIAAVENESSVTLTTANGNMLGTGSPVMKSYLPVGELISGDDYEIKFIGTTVFSSLGATYLVSGNSVTVGKYYIIKDLGSNTNTFWRTVTGDPTLVVSSEDILYAENPGTLGINDGTAYQTDFTCNSNPQTGTGQATVVLTNASGSVTWNQEITQDPTFDIGYVLGGYNVIINDGGSGFTQNNTITIPGDALGGTTPDNDLTLTVSRINPIIAGTYSWSLPLQSDGAITKVISSGTPTGTITTYFLKVTGANTFKVYSDPLMQVPVSGVNFPYQGFTQTSITNVSSTVITLDDATGFAVNDPIVFNDLDSGITLTLGQTYYVLTVAGNNITVAINPGDTAVNAGSGVSGTATKPGSFMLLPEPLIFTPSIVKYNNRVWACTLSNNDSEFVFGKWEELRSDDRRLNALDRAKGYYAPTVNMPGMDLTQLFIHSWSIYHSTQLRSVYLQ